LTAAANELGLDWTQSTVAGIETGRRKIAEEEWLVLQYLIPPREVRQHDGPVSLPGGLVLSAEGYAASLEWMYGEPGRGRTVRPGSLAHNALRERSAPLGRKAEARMARKLQVSIDALEAMAGLQWGRGLMAERDRRLKESGAEIGDRM